MQRTCELKHPQPHAKALAVPRARPGPVAKARSLRSVVILAVLIGGCASPNRQPAVESQRNPVWPPPPEEPRVASIGALHEPRDIGQSPSLWARAGHWLTGGPTENLALQKPFGLALDELGNLCITDTAAKRVYYCDFARKHWHHYETAGQTRFVSPVAVARGNGTFYVADSELGNVFAFRDDGKLVWSLDAPLRRPAGLALAGDALGVVDSQAHVVFVFDLQGKLRFQFGKRGVGPGDFNFPTHITTDNRGHWLVNDAMNCRVQVFDAKGQFVSQFGGNGDTSGHFSRPKGVAVDTFGHVYVADAVFDNFQIFELTGQFLLNIGETGTGPGQFGLPAGIAIGSDGRIYVADSYNHRVQIFKYAGQP